MPTSRALPPLALFIAACSTAPSPDASATAVPDASATVPDATVPDALVPDVSLPDALTSDIAPRNNNLPVDPPAWAGWPACTAGTATQTLSFVHVNDLHASYVPDSAGVSPFARIRAFYERVRGENPYTIFTDGGDDYEKGALAEVLSQGQSTLEITRAMQFDVRVIGNHDFGWSPQAVLSDSHDPHAAVLCSNVHYTGTDPIGWAAQDWVVKQVGCLRVGFAGMVSKPWNELDQQIDDPFYPEFPASWDFVARARELVEAHRNEVDLLVFINHIGLGDDETLARSVPGIDVILSAHSHTFTARIDRVGSTRIIQAGAFAAYVERLDLTYDVANHRLLEQDHFTPGLAALSPPSTTVHATINSILQHYAPDMRSPVGHLIANASPATVAHIATLAAIDRFTADAALVDTSTVWTSWGPGPLERQQLLDAFKIERELPGTPGFNSFYTATVSGTDLARIRDAVPDGWAYTGPDTIDPTHTYHFVLQKRPAYHPDRYLPAGITLGSVTYGSEAWEALDTYVHHRESACRYVDRDEPVAGCTP